MNRTICVATITATALLLTACGGGSGEPLQGGITSDYSSTAAPRHSYTPHDWYSHISVWGRGEDAAQVYIGGDLEPREPLRHFYAENGIRWFIGGSRDGVGVDRLVDYEHDLLTSDDTDPFGLSGDDFLPFIVQPALVYDADLDEPENLGIWSALNDSITLLNDALPPEYQVAWRGADDVSTVYSGEIVVRLETPATIRATCGENAVACAVNTINTLYDYTDSAVLYIPDDFDVSDFSYSRSVIVHELLHALGIVGHVDSIEFPDSIMGASGEYIPNLGHIISRIDREVLQIMYMSQRSDLYNDWGEWSDISHHLMGQSMDDALRFGVALFNGLPQPWVRGVAPDTDLADNSRLFGTATWNGVLFGYSGPSPLKGTASLEVQLASLTADDNEQDLRFRDIYYLNRFESDWSDDSDRWFHTRNIDYKVTVDGNEFQSIRGDEAEQGFVTGSFLGAEHEHMGGTVKRTDLVGAFGGSRE